MISKSVHVVLACLLVLGLVAVPAMADVTGYISHITQGETDWVDYLEVDNLTGNAQSYTVTYFPAGSAAPTTRSVAAGGSDMLDIKAAAPSATCAVVTAGDNMKLRAGYRNTGSGGVAEFFLNDFKAKTVTYLFTTFNSNASWKGLSIMNPGTSTANVTLFAYGTSGLLSYANTTVAPGTRTVGVTGTWFPSLSTSDIVRIMAVSDQDITGIVITGNANSSQITFTQASESVGYTAPTVQ